MNIGKGIAFAGMWIGTGLMVGLAIAYTGDGEHTSWMLLPAAITWYLWDEE
jgi:hypothetical protein